MLDCFDAAVVLTTLSSPPPVIDLHTSAESTRVRESREDATGWRRLSNFEQLLFTSIDRREETRLEIEQRDIAYAGKAGGKRIASHRSIEKNIAVCVVVQEIGRHLRRVWNIVFKWFEASERTANFIHFEFLSLVSYPGSLSSVFQLLPTKAPRDTLLSPT
jgi:hypothetical protein